MRAGTTVIEREDELMNCNVCGAEIPAGAATCPVCGAPAPAAGPAPTPGPVPGYPTDGANAAATNPFAQGAPAQPAMGPQNYGGYDPNPAGPTGYDPYAQTSTALAPAPKKSNKGLIIGIIAGVAVIAALVVCWALGVFGGGSGANGTYKFESAQAMGMNLDADSMKSFGMDVSDFKIEISGSKATINLMGQGGDCECKIEGSTIKFIENGREITGKYDEGKGTITIEQSGVTMVFKK